MRPIVGVATTTMATMLLTITLILSTPEQVSATLHTTATQDPSKAPKMYIFSDVHYDPFFGTSEAEGPCDSSKAPKYGQKKCDTSLALMESAFQDIGEQYAKDGNGIIVITGDFVRHDMDNFLNESAGVAHQHDRQYKIVGQIINTVDYFIKKLVAITGLPEDHLKSNVVVPHPSIVPIIGNEDCIPDYYFNDSAKGYHPALSKFSEAMVNNSLISAEESKTLGKCGFYSRVVAPNGNSPLMLISLNTVVYSVQHQPLSQRDVVDPCGQFAWLQGKLAFARSKGYAVHLLGHIIPFSSKWEQHYLDDFTNIVKDYSDVIRVQWFAHTHMFNFLALSKHKAPMGFDVPGISPIDGQRPSYLRVSTKTYNTNQTWSVDEIHMRYLASSDNDWKDGYQFVDHFNLQKPLTTNQLYEFGKKLLGDSSTADMWQDFEKMHFGGEMNGNHLGKKDKSKLICKMITADRGNYDNCRGK